MTRSRADDVFVDGKDWFAFTLRGPQVRRQDLACAAEDIGTHLQHAAILEKLIEGDGLGR